jgi:hypothetical protein
MDERRSRRRGDQPRALACRALGTFDFIWSIIAVVGGVGAIGLLVYLQARGPRQHQAEDAAREHFDRTGRWPDEPS